MATLRECQSHCRRSLRLFFHHIDIHSTAHMCEACGAVCVYVEKGERREGEKGRDIFSKKKRNRNLENSFLNEKLDIVNREFGAKNA